MKIETLLSAHYIAGKNAMRAEQQGYTTLRQYYDRIGKTVHKGIIRKFERLESRTKSLESIFRNSYNPVTVSCRVVPELYGWNMIPLRKDDNET